MHKSPHKKGGGGRTSTCIIYYSGSSFVNRVSCFNKYLYKKDKRKCAIRPARNPRKQVPGNIEKQEHSLTVMYQQ